MKCRHFPSPSVGSKRIELDHLTLHGTYPITSSNLKISLPGHSTRAMTELTLFLVSVGQALWVISKSFSFKMRNPVAVSYLKTIKLFWSVTNLFIIRLARSAYLKVKSFTSQRLPRSSSLNLQSEAFCGGQTFLGYRTEALERCTKCH